MQHSLLARSIRTVLTAALVESLIAAQPSLAADAADKEPVVLGNITVEADRLQVLPTEPVESVFGFGKTVLETPRSVTTISSEMLDRVMITQIDDLVALSPGSFTQSFFGVAGSLDVRGSPGENYFRGVKRIDNPGNYPQAIGASDRIDVVRGPASPIYGPSKIGGYLNFIPKSARASTGQYLTEPKGEIGITSGSWNGKTLHAEVGGPAEFMGKTLGYYLYGEFENSGSYYDNTSTVQSIYQASFDTNLTDNLRTEFGGMYQDFKGNQVAGWNRLTQDLVDHGTYITGSPTSLDTNHDGQISGPEATAGKISAFIFAPSTLTPAQITAILAAHPNMALVNPGTAHLSGHQVLVAPDDTLQDQVLTLYFDLIRESAGGLKITNKSFFESLDNLNENAYGFSQYAKTWAFEDQLIFGYGSKFGRAVAANFQFGPSVRYQSFEHGDDFDFEYFDRRDITLPSTALDRRALATRGQGLYSSHTKGHFTDAGVALLGDVTFYERLNVLAGARYDYIDMKSRGLTDATADAGIDASDHDGGTSWSASISYQLPYGIRPYVTRAKQTTLILGQGGQIAPSNVQGGTAVASSDLHEYGIKTSFLDNQLYMTVDYFKQSRVDFNAQDTVTNNSTEAKGWEFEARWVLSRMVTLTGAYTNLKVFNLSAAQNGSQFSFAGAADLKGVDPALIYGGVVPSIVLVTDDARKAGIPQSMYSLYAIFSLDQLANGFTFSVGATHVDAVWSGFSKTVKLPAYTLVNLGLHYETASWKAGLQVKNLTDERYFRSNFPDLFGSSVVLPELPRNYALTLGYKF